MRSTRIPPFAELERRRAWSSLATLALTAATACGPSARSHLETAAALPNAQRKPDGVALDLMSEPPPVQNRANAREQLVTLRTPLGEAAAHATVRRFFEAVVSENLGELSAIGAPTTLVSDTRGNTLERVHNYGFLWRQRFTKFDYVALDRNALYRESEIESFDVAHPETLPNDIKVASSGEPLAPDDVLLRVRMLGQSTNGVRVFGDTLTFWLRRDDDRYVIYRMAEDVPL
jgi:hypothetical protein